MREQMTPQVSLAYNYILNSILTFKFAPNTFVSDNQVAKELGISRAPVREAIWKLVTDGLIKSSPEGKMIVAPINMSDIADIFHIRSALENEAIRIIASQKWLSEEQFEHLSHIQDLFSETDIHQDFTKHFKLDDLFHTTLVGYSGSPRISMILDQMLLQMQRIRWLTLLSSGRHDEALREHQDILQAIKNKDLDLCIQSLNAHFHRSLSVTQGIFTDDIFRRVAVALSALLKEEDATASSDDLIAKL